MLGEHFPLLALHSYFAPDGANGGGTEEQETDKNTTSVIPGLELSPEQLEALNKYIQSQKDREIAKALETRTKNLKEQWEKEYQEKLEREKLEQEKRWKELYELERKKIEGERQKIQREKIEVVKTKLFAEKGLDPKLFNEFIDGKDEAEIQLKVEKLEKAIKKLQTDYVEALRKKGLPGIEHGSEQNDEIRKKELKERLYGQKATYDPWNRKE